MYIGTFLRKGVVFGAKAAVVCGAALLTAAAIGAAAQAHAMRNSERAENEWNEASDEALNDMLHECCYSSDGDGDCDTCSHSYCDGEFCRFFDGPPEENPVYKAYQDVMSSLQGDVKEEKPAINIPIA